MDTAGLGVNVRPDDAGMSASAGPALGAYGELVHRLLAAALGNLHLIQTKRTN
jgi:hypothetical protein